MVECQLPKLDVAGSNPVSRSISSTTWKESKIKRYSVYSVFFLKSVERPISRLSTPPLNRGVHLSRAAGKYTSVAAQK